MIGSRLKIVRIVSKSNSEQIKYSWNKVQRDVINNKRKSLFRFIFYCCLKIMLICINESYEEDMNHNSIAQLETIVKTAC